MIVGRPTVKNSHLAHAKRPDARRHTKHWLDGWILAVPSLGLAMIAAVLAVPRATEPRLVPQPQIHRQQRKQDLMKLHAQALEARTHPLPLALRELGELYRRIGRVQYAAQPDEAAILAWRSHIWGARRRLHDASLVQLRALQVELLVAATHHWEAQHAVSDDLIELGGDWMKIAEQNGWRTGHRFALTTEQRTALALRRWTALAGLLNEAPYALPRDLELTELQVLDRAPLKDGPASERRLQIVRRYAALDPNYPAEFAEGVIFAQIGQRERAAGAFMRHLDHHPDGPYALRARNHLLWCAPSTRHETDGI